jgi:hypothetical protein
MQYPDDRFRRTPRMARLALVPAAPLGRGLASGR